MASRFDHLPPDAQRVLLRAQAVDPRIAEIAARLHPSDERDRDLREHRARAEEQRRRLELRARAKRAQDALDGGEGRQVQAAAREELRDAGGELTAAAVDRILDVIREARVARPANPYPQRGSR